MAVATPTSIRTSWRRAAIVRRLGGLRAGYGAIVVLATATLVALRLHVAVDRYDEGVILQGAWRVAHGGVPYRDFFTVYAPGQFYAVAAAFHLFGASVLAERLVDGLFRVALTAIVYTWVARLTDRRFALGPALVAGAAIAVNGNAGYPIFAALSFALACGLCLDRRAATRRRRWLVAAGFAAGCTTLFRLDFAVYLLPAALTVLLLHALQTWCCTAEAVSPPARFLLPRGKGQLPNWDRLAKAAASRSAIANAIWFLVGLAVVVVPAAMLLLRAAPVAVVRFDLLTYPTATLQHAYALPPPSPIGDITALARLRPPLSVHDQFFRLLFYGPLAVLAVTGALLAWALWRDGWRAIDADRLSRAFLLLFGAALIRQEIGRFDEAHALPVGLCALALLSRLLYLWRPWRRGARLHAPATLVLAWATLLYLTLPLVDATTALAATPPWACQAMLPSASCAQLDIDQQQAAAYLLGATSPDESVLVVNAQNENGAVSDVALNMLAGRRSPTVYMEYEPEISNTAAVQQHEIAEITGADVRVVVLVETVAPHEPNASSVPSGVTLLDDYIRAHYHAVYTAGSYSVALRD